jgi:hypothetical protein
MQQMRISTMQGSSVVLRARSWKSGGKCENCKSQKNQILCHEIEHNSSKESKVFDLIIVRKHLSALGSFKVSFGPILFG